MTTLKIGQVAQQANVNIETVRYYEREWGQYDQNKFQNPVWQLSDACIAVSLLLATPF